MSNVYLFTNARDEPNLAEWICHHLLLGFDKIVVFDNKSIVPLSRLGTFGNRVAYIHVEEEGAIKLKLMNRAKDIAISRRASWLLYLDADEFLCLARYPNVKSMLFTFNFANSISINWLMFGTSGHVNQPSGLLMDNFLKSDALINPHVKTFVRPSAIRRIVNPHYYILWNNTRSVAITGNPCVTSPFNPVKRTFTNMPAYIAHYINQSESEYIRRKGRNADDGSGIKKGLYHAVHDVHNDVPNNQLQYKYSAAVKQMLAYYNIKL